MDAVGVFLTKILVSYSLKFSEVPAPLGSFESLLKVLKNVLK